MNEDSDQIMQTDLSLIRGTNLNLNLLDNGSITLFPASTHLFDQLIISTVILLPSAESFEKGCCQLQAKVCARSTG